MKRKFKIGKVKFSDNKCVLIAEAGVNHNGSMRLAEQLIKSAKNNGADIIKFQTYKAEKLVSQSASRFWDWKGELKKKGTQFDSYKRLDKFNKEEYGKLIKLCKKYNIEFMSTPFDLDSVDMLYKLGMKGFKVASCDLNNFLLLEKIAKTKLPILLSTGASNINEVKKTVKFLEKKGCKDICIMQCTLCYPTKPQDANLSAVTHINKTFPRYLIGLSDHTLGTNIASASLLNGVRVIEKHFTINKKLKKSADHWLSIDPKQLASLRFSTSEVIKSIGGGGKKILKCEKKTRLLTRRSIFAKKNIIKGSKISKNDIIAKRPGGGISPDKSNTVIGKISKQDIFKDQLITVNLLR
jgi:N,N'-diacetyllegionaminate synthase